ncbi:hypothetical protein Tco_1184493, partial [Tanacetum coccineum]
IMPPKSTSALMTDAAIKQLIAQGIADALAEYEATRSSGNGDDSYDSGSDGRRHVPTTRECTYSDFLKSEIKKLEIEILKLKVKVDKYVGGLPDMIQGCVMASKPKTMQEAIEFANDLMDQKIHTFAEKQAENKRRLDNNTSGNNAQQPPFKRQNVARACSTRPSEKKEYIGTLPNQGHYKSDCLEIKNRNHGNQTGGAEACGMVYAFGGGETDQDPYNMEDNIDA